jgi:serine/threonine-protein kinase
VLQPMRGADAPLLRGKYRVLEPLGEGGMAYVLAGVHALTERPVAIKRLRPEYASQPVMVERFRREARAAGRIASPHVVEVIDIDDDQDGPFLVMERLLGESLEKRLARGGRMPIHEVVEIGSQVLAGIAAAHAAGVVHRDLKPGNVFFERAADGREVVKILDFGISKIRGDVSDLTTRGDTLGTPSHMAPEQIRHGGRTGNSHRARRSRRHGGVHRPQQPHARARVGLPGPARDDRRDRGAGDERRRYRCREGRRPP